MSDGLEAAATPQAAGGSCSSDFCVGGVAVHLTRDDSAAVGLVPSLMPFRSEPGQPDIRVRVEWTTNLGGRKGGSFRFGGALAAV